ncbi:hypothetical protein [Moorena sp. SIOASIH]|uniref:hypothetical protein n=1 Tax=Moorena sp. SIOASIH TaxID=2607817 RepID=UPI0025CD7C51|nr:hypothetical protein [Moorena sp. SIOASIH]
MLDGIAVKSDAARSWGFPPLAIASRQGETPLGIQVEFLPPYSPELQPAERLWKLVDEPLVNKCFDTIDEIEEFLAKRCNVLSEMKEEIINLTFYHWLASI